MAVLCAAHCREREREREKEGERETGTKYLLEHMRVMSRLVLKKREQNDVTC
jgi:hypothetical protein